MLMEEIYSGMISIEAGILNQKEVLDAARGKIKIPYKILLKMDRLRGLELNYYGRECEVMLETGEMTLQEFLAKERFAEKWIRSYREKQRHKAVPTIDDFFGQWSVTSDILLMLLLDVFRDEISPVTPITEIITEDCEQLCDYLWRNRTSNDHEEAVRQIHQIYGEMRFRFKRAVLDGLIPENPCTFDGMTVNKKDTGELIRIEFGPLPPEKLEELEQARSQWIKARPNQTHFGVRLWWFDR